MTDTTNSDSSSETAADTNPDTATSAESPDEEQGDDTTTTDPLEPFRPQIAIRYPSEIDFEAVSLPALSIDGPSAESNTQEGGQSRDGFRFPRRDFPPATPAAIDRLPQPSDLTSDSDSDTPQSMATDATGDTLTIRLPHPDSPLVTTSRVTTPSDHVRENLAVSVPATSAFSTLENRPNPYCGTDTSAFHDAHYFLPLGNGYTDLYPYVGIIDRATGANYGLRVVHDDCETAAPGQLAILLDGHDTTVRCSPLALESLLTNTACALLPPALDGSHRVHPPAISMRTYLSVLAGRGYMALSQTAHGLVPPTEEATPHPRDHLPVQTPAGLLDLARDLQLVDVTRAGQPTYSITLPPFSDFTSVRDFADLSFVDALSHRVQLTNTATGVQTHLPLAVVCDRLVTGQLKTAESEYQT